ncbi:MAG: AAA family ATPase [Methanoregula sp.]|nr:AAA family ATPase [Methanoregula sp.]
MRILLLRLKNLNSLAGEWTIDFTNPEYVSSGIFAITGPTGAGKSTILDAISLALYGRTPRLGKISKNAGEIMSRQTGEYFSEVEFVSEKGRYRCTWSQNRAHKKPDGDLQSPKHEIVDAVTGVPLETKQAKVQEKVIEVTGLDYPQFTRSILLAQGDFATFLDAKADERAPILEKITGTEIYGQISIAVHERFAREKTSLDALIGRVDTLETITPEQAEAFRAEKQQHENEIAKISAHCKNLEAAAAWLDTLATLETEIFRLQEQKQALAVRRDETRNDLDALVSARKARGLEGTYSGLSALRAQQERDSAEKKNCEEQRAVLAGSYAAALAASRSAQEKRDASAREKQREDVLIRLVCDLDTRIREATKNRDEREEEKRRLEEQAGGYRSAVLAAESGLEGILLELSAARTYLESHAADQKLPESLSGIESFIGQFRVTEKAATTKKEELRKTNDALSDAEQILLMRKTGQDKAAKKSDAATAEVDRLKKEFADISGNRDTVTLRRLVDDAKERLDRIRSLRDLAVRIKEDTTEREKHGAKIAAAVAERTAEEQRLAQLKKDLGNVSGLVQLSEDKLLLLARVKSLEAERENLVAGTPCPLCGSPDHPWCSGGMPVPDNAQQERDAHKKEEEILRNSVGQSEAKRAGIDAEIRAGETAQSDLGKKIENATAELERGCREPGLMIGTDPKITIPAALEECSATLGKNREVLIHAEEKEREIRIAEERVNKEKDALAQLRSEYEKAESYRDTKIGDRERLKKETGVLESECAERKAGLSKTLHDLGIESFGTETLGAILFGLTKRRDGYTANLTRKQELETSQQRYSADAEKNRSLLSAAQKSLADVSAILTGILETLKNNSAKRRELYGEKDPAAEEARCIRRMEAAEQELSAATEAKNGAFTRKNSCEDQIKNLVLKIETRTRELREKEQEFADGLARAGFVGEVQFLSARLSPEKLALLEELEANLVREETEVTTGLREKTLKLAGERERSLTGEKREDLTTAIENDRTRVTGLQIDFGRIRSKLEQYEEQVTKKQSLLEEIAKQKKEFSRWEKLHDLIGSADGKKFRVFAQGLTFETLVVQANRHLRKMSDRYLLIRDKNSPLDLDIMDNYQAGEVRTTKNLSGGERFLVSLALALGLSGMASHNVRIDSLFLDEGFGTLDEDTLESALETLSSLQREGKIIGIISHVPALKERIPVQIQVEKTGGGRSRISGPGCSGPV